MSEHAEHLTEHGDHAHDTHDAHGTHGAHDEHGTHGAHDEHDAQAEHGEHGGHGEHGEHGGGHGTMNAMAIAATLHCLTGCAIGEILGLVIGTATGLSNVWTIVLSVSLAFFFGYALSTLPLLRAGLAVGAALSVVLAADTLSIATMEVVDNSVMAVIPGAMNAGLVNVVFWLSMTLSFVVAFFAAWPVNRWLLKRGKGHALTHEFHGATAELSGARRLIPDLQTPMLVAVLLAFMFGGLVVSIAAELGA